MNSELANFGEDCLRKESLLADFPYQFSHDKMAIDGKHIMMLGKHE